MRHAAAAAFVVALLATFSARAALFDDDEARKRIEATNQRLTQIQKQLEERIAALETQLKSQGLVELFNQVELLKSDVARLRGQIEVLTYEQSEQQKRQRDLYVDLDTRLRKIEGGGAAPSVPAAPVTPGTPPSGAVAAPPVAIAPPAPPPVAPPTAAVAPPAFGPAPSGSPATGRTAAIAADITTEQHSYDLALDMFKGGNYTGAVQSFSTFVKAYPRSPLAPSAQYWLGNAQYALKDYRAAVATQRQLIAAYPDSQKVPDALLNIATSQYEMGDAPNARRSLEDLIARYPQSEAATKARQRLAAK